MKRIISAIPTKYNGVMFRSRLEAKWAAFFDLSGFNWEYEPIDFHGWIPDFVIRGAKEKVYVEIKPIDSFDIEQWTRLKKYLPYVDGEILLLGNFVAFAKDAPYDGTCTSGWLMEKGSLLNDLNDKSETLDQMVWSFNTSANNDLDFAHLWLSYEGRVSGINKSGRNFHGPYCKIDTIKFISDRLKEAQNRTQWNRPK